jgi:hypothetical protein
MKNTSNRNDTVNLSRRQMLGLATLTGAGSAAISMGVPDARAIPKEGAEHEPLEDFKHDLEGSQGWVGPGGSAKESTVTQLPVATSIAGVSMRLKTGRTSRVALAGDRSRVDLRCKGKRPHNGHLTKRRGCSGRFRTRRRLVFPERAWSRSARPWSR